MNEDSELARQCHSTSDKGITFGDSIFNHSISKYDEGNLTSRNAIKSKFNGHNRRSSINPEEYQEFMTLKESLTKFDDMNEYLKQKDTI